MVDALEGMTVLITGSSRGIGAAVARLAHERGAQVVLHGKSDSDELRTLAKELDASSITCDVADPNAVAEAVAGALQEVPGVDALVNNAGATLAKPFRELDTSEWHAIFDVNFLGPIHFTTALVPHMLERGGGRIVNVASIAGQTIARPRIVAYAAAKAALVNVTAVMAKELAPAIAVNAVAPGFTKTDITKDWDDEAWADAGRSLLQRTAEPEEIARVILFLASPDASFVTGQSWVVDGGYGLAGL